MPPPTSLFIPQEQLPPKTSVVHGFMKSDQETTRTELEGKKKDQPLSATGVVLAMRQDASLVIPPTSQTASTIVQIDHPYGVSAGSQERLPTVQQAPSLVGTAAELAQDQAQPDRSSSAEPSMLPGK